MWSNRDVFQKKKKKSMILGEKLPINEWTLVG